MVRGIGFILLLVVLAAAFAVWRLLDHAGQFTTPEEVPVASCMRIDAPTGGEDHQVDQKTGWLFSSAHDRLAASVMPKRGGIFAIDLNNTDAGFFELTAADIEGMPAEFAPHGMSLYRSNGRMTLAVINHTSAASVVELFDVVYAETDEGELRPSLKHLWTVSSEHLRNPNDVVLVDHDRYYVSNDHWYPDGFLQNMETYLILDIGQVVYGEGRHVRVVAEGLSYGNGINASADGSVVYVTETTDNTMRVYDRNKETGELRLRSGNAGRVAVGYGPDNIDRAPDGSLWVTGHPKILKVAGHAADPSSPSPTEVVRVQMDSSGGFASKETIYLNDGTEISTGSVATVYADRFIIGSIFSSFVLDCPLPEAG